jgi:hypothetical protein
MSISDISPIGLPQSLNFKENLPSISDSVTAYAVSVAPAGLTVVTGPTYNNASGTFVANDSGAQLSFNSQNIDMMVPSGMNNNIFCDTRDTTFSGRMVLTITTAPTGTTAAQLNLIGSFASFFDSLILYSNNVPIETIYNYNLVHNMMLNCSVNGSERYGSWSMSGCDTNTYAGVDLPLTVGTYYFNFSIPLMSILGLNLANTSNKLLPVGSIGNLMLRMTTSSQLPFTAYCTAVTTSPTFSVSLDSFNLNLSYINIGDVFGSMLRSSLYDNKFYIKACTYVGANASIPSGSSGNTTLLLNIRNSSVKSLFYQFSTNKSAKCVNGLYDAINPNLQSEQISISGLKTPNRPLNMTQRPAEVFASLLQALGGQSLKGMGGVLFRSSFGASLNAQPAGSDNMIVNLAGTNNGLRNASATDATTAIIASFPNMNYHGIDLERISGSIFSGTNTRSTGINLELTIGTPLTDNTICYGFALSDVIIKVDPDMKTIECLI